MPFKNAHIAAGTAIFEGLKSMGFTKGNANDAFEKVERFRNFGGIRNEEDFVMTESGAKLLGKPKPKTIEEVEAVRAEIG